jgi:hypothetical protein
MTIEPGQKLFDLRLYNVLLDGDEMAIAKDGGERRLRDAKNRGMKDYLGTDSVESHIIGAVGEIAVRALMGKDLVIRSKEGNVADIPPNLQVRCTRKYGQVKVRDRDKGGWLLVGCQWMEKKYRGSDCVVVWGQLPVSVAKRLPKKDPGNYNRPAHWVHWTSFRDITPLIPSR